MATAVARLARPDAHDTTLQHVSWATYEALLNDYQHRGGPRFTYDRGTLEIMTPSLPHEQDNRTLALLVEIAADAFGIDVLNVGSMTFKRADLQRGFEPDSSFYMDHEPQVRGRTRIDLTLDPPPDLVIEIEVANPLLAKTSIFAAMRIPEVWRLGRDQIEILPLQQGIYAAVETSGVLPPLSSTVLTRFIRESRTLPRTVWLQSLRAWLREARASADPSP